MPFGNIVANPSDLKHVVELLGCGDGLGVVLFGRYAPWDRVLEGFTNSEQWYYGSEVLGRPLAVAAEVGAGGGLCDFAF